jgi:hypothetical protein
MIEYILLSVAVCGVFVSVYALGRLHGSQLPQEPFVCQREHVAKPSVDVYYGVVPDWNRPVTNLWLDGGK